VRCARCHEPVYVKEFEKLLKVCPKCGHHARLGSRERIERLVDAGSFLECDAGLGSADPLAFVSDGKRYRDRLVEAQAESGLSEAVVCGVGAIEGRRA